MVSEFKLIGFFKKKTNFQFSFLIPAFSDGNNVYRSEIEVPGYTISGFLHNLQEVVYNIPTSIDPDTNIVIGAEAIYFYFFENQLYGGTRKQVADELIKILKNHTLNPVDEYEIYMFLNIPEKIEESLNKLIESYKDIGLSKDNFYTPLEKIVDTDDASNISKYFKSGSQMLEVSRKTFDFNDFFEENDPSDERVKINGAIFSRKKLSKLFEALIEADQSDIYRDFIVQSFIHYKLDENLKNHPYFKLRKLIDLQPVDENFLKNYQQLLNHTQSSFETENNAMEICMKIEKSATLPAKKTYSKSEQKDFENTLAIAEKVRTSSI